MKLFEQIKLPLDYTEADVWKALEKELSPKERKIYPSNRSFYLINKKSLDSRKKQVHWSLQISLFSPQEKELFEDAQVYQDIQVDVFPNFQPKHRPIVLGLGPAGLFAAYYLALAGLKPILIEQGEAVEERKKTVGRYWKKGLLHKYSNVQYGEGGAGTFSDGKLATGIKHSLLHEVILSLAKASGKKEIAYLSKAHIGTNVLPQVLRYYRQKLLELGAEIHYQTICYDLEISDNAITKIYLKKWEKNKEHKKAFLEEADLHFSYFELPCEALFLACGHSAREMYYLLAKKGISLESKSFAVGLRVEHRQKWLNACQYGEESLVRFRDSLPSADYKVTFQSSDKRGVYSFCMCPGGLVVASASGKEQIVTNGMSLYERKSPFANSALLVTVQDEDFEKFYQEKRNEAFSLASKKLSLWAERVEKYPVLKGIYFQEWIESKAYALSPDGVQAPAQSLLDFLKEKDFLSEKEKENLKNLEAKKDKLAFYENANLYSYRPGVFSQSFQEIYPSFILNPLREALFSFDEKMKGFISVDAHLIGPETRSSAPVRILRSKETGEASCRGIYPCGEGAGYAGGISSAAVDGLKQAKQYIWQQNKKEDEV